MDILYSILLNFSLPNEKVYNFSALFNNIRFTMNLEDFINNNNKNT